MLHRIGFTDRRPQTPDKAGIEHDITFIAFPAIVNNTRRNGGSDLGNETESRADAARGACIPYE